MLYDPAAAEGKNFSELIEHFKGQIVAFRSQKDFLVPLSEFFRQKIMGDHYLISDGGHGMNAFFNERSQKIISSILYEEYEKSGFFDFGLEQPTISGGGAARIQVRTDQNQSILKIEKMLSVQ